MVGLLWFDDDPKRGLKQKVENAARRYREKFGRNPVVCYVHPSMLGEPLPDSGSSSLSIEVNGFHLRVVPRRSVLRYHLWLAEEDERPARP